VRRIAHRRSRASEDRSTARETRRRTTDLAALLARGLLRHGVAPHDFDVALLHAVIIEITTPRSHPHVFIVRSYPAMVTRRGETFRDSVRDADGLVAAPPATLRI
jgi:hypothetical protein